MSNYSITVDTGQSGASGRHGYSEDELSMFYRNVGVMQAALEGFKGSVRGLRSGLQGVNRCFAQMGFAVRDVLSGLMNARNVVDGLKAGMKNLHRYSRTWWRSFAGTLETLAGNAVYLRNSLAAMAAPMLKSLAPAIEYVTDQFVGLFNLINQFFARLTGASTYVAARRVSGSIDGVGDSASHASDDVKELRRQLMGFDELNVLTALEDASGGDSGGSGGGSVGEVQFEQRAIESGLAGFVDALKTAFNEGDWQALGTLIGSKINAMVESVDWSAAGAKVGYYINGLFSTTYWTLETVNFTNIGSSVAEFLNSALAEIDFTTVGATVALLFTSLAETIAGFVDEFDWVQFAEKMADGLNGFVGKLGEKLDAVDWGALALKLTQGLNTFIAKTDWANAGKVLAGRVNDLLEILGTASANFDWSGAGEALSTAVNNLFKNVDWDKLGTWLNDTLLGVLDFGIAFFNGFDAVGFATNVGKALAKVDWNAVAEKLWTLFKAALEKLGEFFGTLLFGGSADVKLNLALLRDGWETITKWLGIDKPLSALIGLLKNNWQTIAKFLGIDNPLTALVGLVKNGWNGIKAWLGIDDPLSALVGLVKDNWTTIAAFVGTAVSVFTALKKDGWTDIASFVGTAVSIIANLTSAGSNWVKDGLTKWFGGGKNPAASIVADLTSTGSNWVKNGITKWFGEGKNPAASFIADLTSTGSNWVKNGLTKWFGGGSNPVASIVGDLTSENSNWKTAGGIGAWFSGLFKSGHATVSSALNLTKTDSNWNKKGGIGAWFSGLFKSGHATVSSALNLTKTDSNWNKKGGVGAWFNSLFKAGHAVVSVIANLTSSGSNWKTKGGITKWFGGGSNPVASFIANLTSTGSNWVKNGITKWFGGGKKDPVATFISNLTKNGSNWKAKGTVADWIGKTQTFLADLEKKWPKQTSGTLFGENYTTKANLEKKDSNQSSGKLFGTAITVTATLSSTINGLTSFVKKIADAIKEAIKNIKAEGGGAIANGRFSPFASGGVIRGGVARYLESVPHYASGTTRAHGTVFVAGEAGPEIMGHINGRTEILNKSQLAQTMYSAVLSAMSQSVSALGTFLSGQLANCTNAIVKTVGSLSGVANITYHEPVMASGTVMPYDVAAQIARTGMDIQNTLDANNEDLIQTIISVAGQIVAAVQSQGNREQGTGNRNGGGLTAQQIIDDINRRAQMFGSSPVLN